MHSYHLAQLNIARMLYPLDDPKMYGFVSRLEDINALAENTKGFVWRLQTPSGDATSLRVFEDDMLIINMSVWQSIDDLYAYTYYSDHAQVFRNKKEWFELIHDKPMMALWWIPVGHIPSTQEAKAKLELLECKGATQEAFTFKKRFDPPTP